MFENTYPPYDHERAIFGDAWCGPELYEHGKECLVARYLSEDDSDGQSVEIYCTPMPARFYTIRALEGPNSIGEIQPGFEFETGSSMAQLAADIGQAVADGMLGLRTEPAACPTCGGRGLLDSGDPGAADQPCFTCAKAP